MRDILLATIVVLLVTFWALGYYVYNASSVIHFLLLIAGLAVLLRLMKEKEYK